MNKKSIFIWMLLTLFFTVQQAEAQRPNGVYWSPELRLNPALTGIMTGKWRVIEHHRNVTFNDGVHLNSNTFSADFRKEIAKTAGNYGLKVQESTGNTFGFGIMDDRHNSDSVGVVY